VELVEILFSNKGTSVNVLDGVADRFHKWFETVATTDDKDHPFSVQLRLKKNACNVIHVSIFGEIRTHARRIRK
jgi:hypothetical protein